MAEITVENRRVFSRAWQCSPLHHYWPQGSLIAPGLASSSCAHAHAHSSLRAIPLHSRQLNTSGHFSKTFPLSSGLKWRLRVILNCSHATEGAEFHSPGCHSVSADFTCASIVPCFFYSLVNILLPKTAFVASHVDSVLPASIFVCSRYTGNDTGDLVKGHLDVRNAPVSYRILRSMNLPSSFFWLKPFVPHALSLRQWSGC